MTVGFLEATRVYPHAIKAYSMIVDAVIA